MPADLTFFQVQCAKQKDGHNCSVWCLRYLRQILSGDATVFTFKGAVERELLRELIVRNDLKRQKPVSREFSVEDVMLDEKSVAACSSLRFQVASISYRKFFGLF